MKGVLYTQAERRKLTGPFPEGWAVPRVCCQNTPTPASQQPSERGGTAPDFQKSRVMLGQVLGNLVSK